MEQIVFLFFLKKWGFSKHRDSDEKTVIKQGPLNQESKYLCHTTQLVATSIYTWAIVAMLSFRYIRLFFG